MTSFFARWIAQGFGVGKAPFAPGTFGTLVGIPFFVLLQPLGTTIYLTTCAVFFGIGVWASQKTVDQLGVADHPSIVWDEVVGYLVTMSFAPAEWWWIIIGFAVFRFYDIIKPWPVSWFDENVDGGLGVMADDLVAGLLGAATIVILSNWI